MPKLGKLLLRHNNSLKNHLALWTTLLGHGHALSVLGGAIFQAPAKSSVLSSHFNHNAVHSFLRIVWICLTSSVPTCPNFHRLNGNEMVTRTDKKGLTQFKLTSSQVSTCAKPGVAESSFGARNCAAVAAMAPRKQWRFGRPWQKQQVRR